MKLHLPHGLRKALLACLAFSYIGSIATTISTGALGLGACLIYMNQAEALDISGGSRGAGWKADGTVNEDVRLTGNALISPQSSDVTITGTLNAQGYTLTIWNNGANGPYTLTLTGTIENLGDIALGGRNTLAIESDITCTKSNKTLNVLRASDSTGLAGAAGSLVLKGEVNGYSTINVEQTTDGAGATGSADIEGTFNGTGTLEKTGAGALSISGTLKNVTSFTAKGGTTSLSGTAEGLEQVDVVGATFELSGTADALKDVNVSGGTFTMSGEAKNLETVKAESSSTVTLAQGGVAEKLTELTSTGSTVTIDGSAANLQTLTMDGKKSTVTLNGNVAGLKSITLQGENYDMSATVGRSVLNVNTNIDDLSSLAIKHLSEVNLAGDVSGAIDVTLLIGTLNVQEGATLYLNDGSSITMNTEGGYSNTLNNLGVIAGEGTLSKSGQDTLMLAGEIKHTGKLAIQEGAVQWGNGAQSQQDLSFTEVEVGSGAKFVVNHSAGDASRTDISLAGGKMEVKSEAPENADEPLQNHVVSFGKLTIKTSGDTEVARIAAADAPAEVSVAKVAQDKVGGVAFSELSGSGELNITSASSSNGSGKSVFILNSINNFDGKVYQSLGSKNDGAHVELGSVHLDEGRTATWEMAEGVTAVSSTFAKTGAGSFTIKGADDSLFAVKTEDNGEFVMGYDGSFTLDGARMTLELGKGTTLRYTAENLYDFDPSAITLNGVVYVNMDDFTEEQLKEGVNLGLRSAARGRVQLVGQSKLEIYAESGELHLRTASDADWSEKIKQDANNQLDSKNPEEFAANFKSKNDYVGVIRHGVGLTDKEDGYFKKSVILTDSTFTADDVKNQLNNVVGGSAVNFNPRKYVMDNTPTLVTPEWREVYTDEVWMYAQSGSYGIMAGGNYADAKAGFHDDSYQRTDGTLVGIYVTFDAGHYAVSFEGDSHIIVGEKDNQAAAPTVGSIVGGNYGNSVWHTEKDKTNSFMQNGEPLTSSFVGNSWISVNNGQVDWIVGGSYQSVYDFPRSATDHSAVQDVVADPTKFSQGSFTGDSHVSVYTLMSGDGRNDPDTDFVAGGNLIDMQVSLDYLGTPADPNSGSIPDIGIDGGRSEGTEWERQNVGAGKANSIPFYFNGNSYVMVDLGRDKGEEVENPGADSEFGKMLVGGDYIRHDRGWAEHWGNTYLLITNAKGVKFTERVIGGSYDDGNSYTHMTGDSNLMIDSGTFYNMVVAGSNQGKITDMHAEQPITSLRKALFSIIEGGTYLTITGGRYTGYASSLEERIPHYTLASRDHLDAIVRHSIGRVAIVGGNYLSQAANATKNLMTLNKIKNGTHLSISNAVVSGHVVGASVMEGDSHHDDDDFNDSTNGSGESNQWVPGFRGDLYVSSVSLKINNTEMIQSEHFEEDSSYSAEGWVPRIVGGYLLHVADDCLNDQIVTAQWDEAGEGFYYPGIEVGKIDLTITNSSVFDVVGGSWVACLDVYAEEVHDFLTYDCKKRDDGTTYNLNGVKQDDITISMDKVNVKGDIIAAGMQGGITKMVTAKTTVNLTSDISFEEPNNPYRKENIVTGAYFSIRHKNYAASRYKNTWDNEFDPWYSFYTDMHYAGENANAAEQEGESSRHNVSYVEGMRTLNFTTASDTYGNSIRNTILLNFDHVDVAPHGIVNAAGLLITDTGNNGDRDTIYLHGGGEMQLVPDFMLIPVWEEKDANGTLSVPEVASSYKWLHNNSYIVVQGQGTMLTLLSSETRGVKFGDRQDWITMGKVYDNLLNVQKLRVEEGSILHIDQRLELNSALKVNAQPVAVRDNIYMCQGSSMMLDTNISLNEMRTREDAAIREAEIITDLRTDANGKVINDKKPEANRDPFTVVFDGTKGATANPTFRLHIDRVEESFYDQDKFRRYLIDYVNPEAFHSLWARELGEEITETSGSISYDNYTKETLDKWFARSEFINGYDKYRIRVKDNEDGTFSLVLEGMRIPDEEEDDPTPGPPSVPPTPLFPAKPTGYHEKHAHTPNGKAGGKLLDEYYPDPSDDSPDRDGVLKRIFELNVQGRTQESDRLQAAVAGSSIAALGMAVADDVERQMRLMRNRATKNLHKDGFITKTESIDRGKAGIYIHEYPEYLPAKRYSLWINGEGDFRTVNGVSTDPGYRMNAWGGSVGGSYSLTDNFELGLALTAMYGDFRSKGPDSLNGDMDTKYLSAFARYDSGHWSHSFIATFGLVDIDATRTVNIGGDFGSYSTRFSTDGYAFGLMYEVGYTFVLNEKKTMTLQPIANIAWRHVSLDGFTETGSDAALRVGKQESDTIIIGAGARAQALVGSETLNRDLLFELRALAKSYVGDSHNMVEVGFADRDQRAKVRSRKQGSFGFEIGGGLTLPLSPNTANWEHAIFIDINFEVVGAMRNANFTLGYKVSF